MSRLSNIHKHGGASPNVDVPTLQPSVNYKEFREAYKACQARREAAGKLVLPTKFNAKVR